MQLNEDKFVYINLLINESLEMGLETNSKNSGMLLKKSIKFI